MSEITYLDVPFNEKDEAKSLGAKWDAVVKKWYIPVGVSISQFSKWLPRKNQEGGVKFIAPIYLAKSYEICWSCSELTEVFCIAASSFIEDDIVHRGFVTLSNLTNCQNSLKQAISIYTKNYKPAHSKQAGSIYYMNHCVRCNAKIGDFYMHNEPDGAFCPTDEAQAKLITLTQIIKGVDMVEIDANYGLSEPCFISQYAKYE